MESREVPNLLPIYVCFKMYYPYEYDIPSFAYARMAREWHHLIEIYAEIGIPPPETY